MEFGSDVWLVDNVEDINLEMLRSTEKDLKNQYSSYLKLTKEEIEAREGSTRSAAVHNIISEQTVFTGTK